MKISPTYANRTDLSSTLKWKFTIEERIGRNSTMQKVWRGYRSLPSWVDDLLVALFFVLAIISLSVGDALKTVSDWFETEERDGPSVWLMYFALVAIMCFFTWWGLALIGALFPFCFLLWLHSIMDSHMPKEAAA